MSLKLALALMGLAALASLALFAFARRARPEGSWRERLRAETITEAEFTEIAVLALQDLAPARRAASKGPLAVDLGDASGQAGRLHLDNAYRNLSDDPDARAGELERFLNSILADESGEPFDASAIRPVLRSRELAESMAATMSAGPAPRSLIREPFAGDVEVLYVVDRAQSLEYLAREDLSALAIEERELRALAIRALVAAVQPKRESLFDGRAFMLVAGGDLESSFVLVDSLWQAEEQRASGSLTAAIPARDLLIAAPSDDAEAVAQIAGAAERMSREAAYPISALLFERTADGWRVRERAERAR